MKAGAITTTVLIGLMTTGICALTGIAIAEDPQGCGHQMNSEIAEKAFPSERPYSPWIDQSFPQRPLFGDTHLHTKQSFDPNESAFYYGRVIEIPTPRWTAYDVKHYGLTPSDEVEMITQERAYTSPIWYMPGK